tara:strand:- start:209 stop:406 length:198 start_codon:yes stop_codon:yes gene_type:complete
MEIYISIILFSLILLIILIFSYQNKTSQNIEFQDEIFLEEWDCPECGFHVQMGTTCTYCYEDKPK